MEGSTSAPVLMEDVWGGGVWSESRTRECVWWGYIGVNVSRVIQRVCDGGQQSLLPKGGCRGGDNYGFPMLSKKTDFFDKYRIFRTVGKRMQFNFYLSNYVAS